MIREVFEEHYRTMLALEQRLITPYAGLRVEIGAGSSILKSVDPTIVSSDVVPSRGHDLVVDAQRMPFADGEVRTLFGVHCFHHLPNPYEFLAEVARVTRPGGGAILIEPYYGPMAALLYKHLFPNEHFDSDGPPVTTAHRGPMSDANQALSYIVFKREAPELARRFPALRIAYMRPLRNWIRYLVSGGINFRQLLPNAATPLLKGVEAVLAPFDRLLALHHAIVVKHGQ
jgi:SAM-dependent methyltransferase